MNTSRRLTITYIVAIVIIIILAVTCYVFRSRTSVTDPNAPLAGRVRVLVHKIAEDATTVHWKWTFIGDRRWVSFSSPSGQTEDVITLHTDANPFARALASNGSDVLTYELNVQKLQDSRFAPMTYSEDITLQGNRGIPAINHGKVGSSSQTPSINQLVTVLATRDIVVSLPATVILAKVAGKTLSLRFTK